MAYAVGVNNAAGQNAGATTPANTVSITPTLPSGAASGDRIFVVECGSNTSATTPANWNVLGTKDLVVGSGAVSAGGGQRYLTVSYRDYDGVWSMPAFTLTSATQNSHWIGAVAVRKSNSTATFDTPTISTAGADFGTANTAHSAATGAFTTHRGGVLFIASVQNDNVTMTSPTITQTSGVFDTPPTELCDGGTATGNDVAGTLHTVSVHTEASGAITFGGTLSAASQGGSLVFEQTETPATGTLDVGYKSVSSGTDSGTGYIRDNKIILSQAGRIDSISIFWGAAGGNVRAGVYANNGSDPEGGALLASTAETAVVAGWQKINVTSPTILLAGTYWIGQTVSGAATFRWEGGVGTGTYCASSSFTYGALPSTRGTVDIGPTAGDYGMFASFTTAFSGDGGTCTGTATITGAGSVAGGAFTGSGTCTGTATITGAGVVARFGSGSVTATVTATGAGTVPAAKAETLTDDFSTQDTTKWSGWNGSLVQATGGELSIVPDNTFTRQISTNNSYDLSSSYALVEVTGLGSAQFIIMQWDTGPFTDYFQLFYQVPNLVFRETVGGVTNDTSITYNATDHRWWKIRESAGTVYWETSPNGTSGSWTTQRSKTWAIPQVTSLYGYLNTYTSSGTTPATLDNFNLPVTAVNYNGGGTLTVTGTATGAGVVGTVKTSTALTATATITGAGVVGAVGASSALTATATATSAGVVGAVGASSALTATATITGAGSAAVTGYDGSGSRSATATITGAGVVGTVGASSLTVTATIAGAGIVGAVSGSSLTAAAVATGAGAVAVYGTSTLTVTATISGSASSAISGSGDLSVAAAITGAGVVGTVADAALSVAAASTGAGILGATADGPLSATAAMTGGGVVAITGSGSLEVTAVLAGTASGALVAGGTVATVAAILGDGVVNRMTTGVVTVTATLTGSGLVASEATGTRSVTAAITGTGVVGLSGTGTLSVTTTIGGTASSGPVGSGSLTVTATISAVGAGGAAASLTAVAAITGSGFVARYGSGHLTVTAVFSASPFFLPAPLHPPRVTVLSPEVRITTLMQENRIVTMTQETYTVELETETRTVDLETETREITLPTAARIATEFVIGVRSANLEQENREILIPAEVREMVLPVEVREITFGDENRSTEIVYEAREIKIPVESRADSIQTENREVKV